MDQKNEQMTMDMLIFIINQDGKNNRKEILNLAADQGIHGGTVMLGQGKARSKLLRTLGIDSLRRELVLLIAPTEMAKKAFKYISDKIEFDSREANVGFRIPLNKTTGISEGTIETDKIDENYINETSSGMNYRLVISINDINSGEDVLDIVEEAGGLYGLIMHGRGAASHEREHVFNMDIEPEKDVLLTVAPAEKTENIINNVSKEFDVDTENSGILFAVDLKETSGLLQ